MKKAVLILVILALLGLGAFFGRTYLFGEEDKAIKIVMNTEATDISPYGLNLNNATRIRNIFEALVAFDRNLKVVPGLAVTWGNLDDTTWEFRLRKGLSFHDGTAFTAEDVIRTYEEAKASENPQIMPNIETIESMEITELDKIIIKTKAPDPLLLSKLTNLLIHKDQTIGTGPYTLDEWVAGDHFTLLRNENYWGRLPVYEEVIYEVMPNRREREKAFEDGDIDILVGITEEQAMELPEAQVKTGYGLEVNFLMFKLDEEPFNDKLIREEIRSLFDPEKLESIGNHFVRSTNQFIAPGVFGYNQDIPNFEYSAENEARDLFGNRLQPVTLDYLNSYKTLSEYVNDQLRKAGFYVKSNPSEPDALMEKIRNNDSQAYLIGWRSADGDAGAFFDAFMHSEGTFNQGRYKNEEIDKLIEESRVEMEPQKRLSLLQEISAKSMEDLIGIPLFETSRLFAVQQLIDWEPRLDGQVLGVEIH